jgi:hypothetical protein
MQLNNTLRRFVIFSVILLSSIPANAGEKFVAKKHTTKDASESKPTTRQDVAIKHVLLLTIDGFHALDLNNYVESHPQSAMARLKEMGLNYTDASTQKPSDSFPGIVGMTTGGTPYSTGIYYEVSYDRNLSPAGSNCSSKGAEIALDESIDINPDAQDGGGGVDANKVVLDGAQGCKPVFPHQLLRVNTIFEVIKAAKMHTPWTDKQVGYEILNGPSGHGIDDLFLPELHYNAVTKSLEKIEGFDDFRLTGIINQIDGKDHTGAHEAPVPAIFGMTFQAITVGQKLKAGMGYSDAEGTPSPDLLSAIDHTDKSLGKILDELKARGLSSSTAIILTAKHGQSPIDISKKLIVDEKTIPGIINGVGRGLVAETSGDDILFVWLTDSGRTKDVVSALAQHQQEAHIERILSGTALQLLFPSAQEDSRAPDIVIEPELGVIYAKPNNTGIAEHGGFGEEDTHVPLLIANPGIKALEIHAAVQTTQIAPTILRLLGLDPNQLKAVQIEKTQVLPGL